MGFKLVERVYNLDKKATSPSEQAVLLALAYRANDRTLFCYPKQETLAEMTHLSRATVVNALNALRRNGFIDWKSGGLANKKGKYGRPLSNDYKLNLPPGKSKIEKISSEPSVQQLDTPVSNGKTLQCLTVRHSSVQQLDTAVSNSKTPTVIYNNNLTNNKLNNKNWER
jgi:DNA-binding Lrp family transcriptional regulator